MILNKYLVLRSEITSNQEFLFITNSGKVVYEKLIYRIINKYFNNISIDLIYGMPDSDLIPLPLTS